MTDQAHSLTDLLDGILENAPEDQESFKLGEILTSFGSRSHGPLLFLPAFLAAAPTGAIPGVAIGMAVLLIILSLQMVFSPSSLWMPARITQTKVPRDKLTKALSMARPVARVIDRLMSPRLTWLVEKPFSYGVALLCCGLAVLMIPFAFIPFAASLPGFTIALFGVALVSEDGAAILAAVFFTLVTVVAAFELLVFL
jgi:hypothetical protein